MNAADPLAVAHKNALAHRMENDEVIARFLTRLEDALPKAEHAIGWGKADPDLSKTMRSLYLEIQNVRRAAILQFEAGRRAND